MKIDQSDRLTPLGRKQKILFVCKQRHTYSEEYSKEVLTSSGLYNSANFVVQELNSIGVPSKLVDVVDNNDIDREVSLFKPTMVIIEALWVVPEKFDVLSRLHPNVKWVVRLHSKLPFLSGEGNAMDWIFRCAEKDNVYIGVNSKELDYDLSRVLPVDKILYLPNVYRFPEEPIYHQFYSSSGFEVKKQLRIGGFGAIRPLKNQLMQAFAAITYAEKKEAELTYYINTGRVEGYQAKSILKNIRDLFARFPQHKLVEVGWLEHEDFIQLVRQMDLGMQLSYSETFNIVAADFVSNYIPFVGSSEIDWLYSCLWNVDNLEYIHAAMDTALSHEHTIPSALQLKVVSKENLLSWVKMLNNFYN